MTEDRERLTLEPDLAGDPEVSRWLAAMQDARSDTLAELEDASDEMLDVRPAGAENSIGTTLYHVALIEADWIHDDLLGHDLAGSDLAPLFPFDDRDEQGVLTGVADMTLDEHLDRLARVRDDLMTLVAPMTLDDLLQVRERAAYDVSGIWVLHHLLQHEAEHRAELGWLCRHIA